MMRVDVRIPTDDKFNYAECEELYNQCREQIQDDSFEEVINRTMFSAFYISETNELIGCIYYFWKGKRLFVNVFANRGHSELNLECFKYSLTWWKCNIYANAIQRTSKIGCLRCGFERIKDDLFVYRRKKHGK